MVSIEELRNPVAGVIEVNGEPYNVLKFRGHQYQEAASFDGETSMMRFYELVAKVVPSLPWDAVLEFDAAQCAALLVMAGQGIAAVERLFPNAVSPDGGSTSPGSSPSIP